MNTNFLLSLILEVEEFENSITSKNNPTIEDFRIWLNEKKYKSESPTKLFVEKSRKVAYVENEICKQVLLLGRFSKQMIRKGLADVPELANEEFTYIYRLMDEPMLTKTQLIERNAHEKQTGTQIINRLMDHGFVEEFQDTNDKRIRRLKLTKTGEEIFHKSVKYVNITSQILSAKLTDKEKENLLDSLKKLNEFHFNVYLDHKDRDIQEIKNLI